MKHDRRTVTQSKRERGIIMMTFALSAAMMILVIGLAIDGGMLYLTKNKLQSAGDAAALAAARSLNTSLNVATQITDAQTAASSFFNANFPNNYLMSTSHVISTNLAYGTTSSTLNTVYVTTTASSQAATYFMRWLGYSNVAISVTGTASRRDINVILVMDISSSMNNVQTGTSSSACALMKTAAVNFISQFSNNRDTIGLVTFNDGATSYAPTTNFNPSMTTTINGVSCTGDTNTPAGLHAAYAALQALNSPTKLNVIVLFTDGWAEAITADFPVKMVSDSRYGDGTGTYSNMNALYTMTASTCKDSANRSAGTAGWNPFKIGDTGAGATNNTIRGTISENSNDTSGPDSTGYTSGPWVYGTSSGWTQVSGLNSSCAVMQNGTPFNGVYSFRHDIAYIPSFDLWGNATVGYRTNYNGTTGNYVANQDYFPTGSPYVGRLRPDQPVTLYNASFNAAESQGITARSDASLNPMILTIGLGGNSTFETDAEFLIRLANVPGGSTPGGTAITNALYSTSEVQGLYVYSPNSSQLANAFQKVASFLVELTH
jgi:Flp pilus assembly protein TadG